MTYKDDLKELQESFKCTVESCDGFNTIFNSECPHWDYSEETDYTNAKKILQESYRKVG